MVHPLIDRHICILFCELSFPLDRESQALSHPLGCMSVFLETQWIYLVSKMFQATHIFRNDRTLPFLPRINLFRLLIQTWLQALAAHSQPKSLKFIITCCTPHANFFNSAKILLTYWFYSINFLSSSNIVRKNGWIFIFLASTLARWIRLLSAKSKSSSVF